MRDSRGGRRGYTGCQGLRGLEEGSIGREGLQGREEGLHRTSGAQGAGEEGPQAVRRSGGGRKRAIDCKGLWSDVYLVSKGNAKLN